MSTHDNTFDSMLANLADTPTKMSRDVVEELVTEALAHTQHLTNATVRHIREITGWSRASIYRIRDSVKPTNPVEALPADATFIDRLVATEDPSTFVFDGLALAILKAKNGNMRGFRDETHEFLRAIGSTAQLPSEAQLSRRAKNELPDYVRDSLRHGHGNRYRKTLQIRHEYKHVNDVLQMDEFILDIAVVVPEHLLKSAGFEPEELCDFVDDDGDPMKPFKVSGDRTWLRVVRPRLTVTLEGKSRYVRSWCLLPHTPKAEDAVSLVVEAMDIQPVDSIPGAFIGGHFEELVSDNAMAFRAHVIDTALTLTGAGLTTVPGFHPPGKAKVERYGGTVQRKALPGLPGHITDAENWDGTHMLWTPVEELLTFDRFLPIIDKTIDDYNHVDIHSAHKKTPAQAHVDGCPNPIAVAPELIAQFMLPMPTEGGRRTVHPSGVKSYGTHFIAEDLFQPGLLDNDVYCRAFHHRRDKIAVFERSTRRIDDTRDRFVCMAANVEDLTEEERNEITKTRSQLAAAVSKIGREARELIRAGDTQGTTNLVAAAANFTPGDPANQPAETGPVVNTTKRPKTRKSARNARKSRPAGPAANEDVELDAEEAMFEESLENDT